MPRFHGNGIEIARASRERAGPCRGEVMSHQPFAAVPGGRDRRIMRPRVVIDARFSFVRHVKASRRFLWPPGRRCDAVPGARVTNGARSPLPALFPEMVSSARAARSPSRGLWSCVPCTVDFTVLAARSARELLTFGRAPRIYLFDVIVARLVLSVMRSLAEWPTSIKANGCVPMGCEYVTQGPESNENYSF